MSSNGGTCGPRVEAVARMQPQPSMCNRGGRIHLDPAETSPGRRRLATVSIVDIAINLVENYLRLTGYLTLSEFEVQRRDHEGRYKTVTDVDVMAIRMPAAAFVGDLHRTDNCELLELHDPVLALEPDTIDVIIGEVKQGPAELNPGIKDHAVLHSMLRRLEWLYATELETVVRKLQQYEVHRSPARGGGMIRTRIVAFGRSRESSECIISLSHIVTTLLRFFEEHEEALRPVQFREPAPAFLRLLVKAGFAIDKIPLDPASS